MKVKIWLIFVYGSTLFYGCTGFHIGTDIQAGRQAFLVGNNEAAVAYFQSAAQKDPTYIYGTALRQNIWSHVGRAQYAVGRFSEARTALQKSLLLEQNNRDIARLYLGLAMARSGDRQQGLGEIESGMKGIHEWLEYITEAHRFSFGQFWDPRREIRSAIQGDLAMLSGKDIDWQKLIADGEWVGKRMEEEGDLARRDERSDLDRDSGGNDGQP